MSLGKINFIIFIFFLLFVTLSINITTALHLLLTAEFLWITLYILTLLLGLIYDNLNMLSLTFFFLVLSAVEFGIGLIIILIQNIFNRSINLNYSNVNNLKFLNRFLTKVNLNNIKVYNL